MTTVIITGTSIVTATILGGYVTYDSCRDYRKYREFEFEFDTIESQELFFDEDWEDSDDSDDSENERELCKRNIKDNVK